MINTNPLENKIKLSTKLNYGIGNLGYSIVTQLLILYFTFYATAVLNLPGTVVGIIMALGAILDAVTDPIMGYVTDNIYIKKYGRRHFYILIGMILLTISNLVLWNVGVNYSIITKTIWILTTILVLKIAVTIYIVPYMALGTELTNDYNESISIQAIRSIFFILGILLASSVILLLFFKSTPKYPIGQLNPKGYSDMATFTTIIFIICGGLSYYFTKGAVENPTDNNTTKEKLALNSIFAKFKNAFINKDFKALVIGNLMVYVSIAVFTTIGMHSLTYTFKLNSFDLSIIFGVQLIVCIISQPVWVYICKRLDKRESIILALKIGMLSYTIYLGVTIFKGFINVHLYYLIAFSIMNGFAAAPLYSLPFSMIADISEIEKNNTGESNEGVLIGGLTFGYKFGQSICVFLLGILLDIIGFDSHLKVQSISVEYILGIALSLGSIIAIIVSIHYFKKYTISRSHIEELNKH